MKLSRIFSALAMATGIAAASDKAEEAPLSTTFNGEEVPSMRNLTASDMPHAISEGNW
jgi:hypothetical protein